MPLAEMKLPDICAAVGQIESLVAGAEGAVRSGDVAVRLIDAEAGAGGHEMITLVLSPYSAGGAPSITSIDCTASTGI